MESQEAIKDVIFLNLFLTKIQELYHQKKKDNNNNTNYMCTVHGIHNTHINFTTMEEKLQNIPAS